MNWEKMSTMELVRWHNANCPADKKVKRFSDRTTAIKRCQRLFDSLPKDAAPKKEKTILQKSLESAKKLQRKKAAPATNSGSVEDKQAAGIAASWQRADVYAKRTQRHNVEVDGVVYGSVRKAFIELDLPLKEHIPFRMALKNSGHSTAYDKQWKLIEKK